jgi:hypothetical protein
MVFTIYDGSITYGCCKRILDTNGRRDGLVDRIGISVSELLTDTFPM